jgi:signal transduction histidine kinase
MNPIAGTLLDTAPCGFISFDDAGVVVAANATLLERIGCTADGLIGQRVESILNIGSRIFYQTHFFPLLKLHGHAHEVFIMLRAASGDDVGMLCNAVRRERDGGFVTDCVLMEVIERRKFEEALIAARQEADRANVELVTRNKEAVHAAEVLEQQALELELQQQQLHDQATELEAQSEELHMVNEHLTTLNEDLQKQRSAANEASQAKSNFLAVMSHELRTPLNAIGGYVQLLEMEVHGPITQAQRDTLERIDRSQRHLLRLINEILNLSRIEAGHVDYVVEPVTLATLIDAVLPMIEPQARAKDITLERSVPADIVARADSEKVQQILVNLLTNAVKFTGENGTVCIEASAAPDDRVVIRVSDDGIGIPEEMIDKVFEPFVQVDSSKSRSAEGTGLGLAISRDLARGMRGDLTVKSSLGNGSTFDLLLPQAVPEESR